MLLLRELWGTSPSRTALVVGLTILSAVGTSLGAALAGPLLLHRSGTVFALLALSLSVMTLGKLSISLIAARLTSDWAYDVRRRLCRVAFGQDLHSLERTPVGELLDRIDGDVHQVAMGLRTHGVSILSSFFLCGFSVLTAFFLWWPVGVCALLMCCLLAAVLLRPLRRIGLSREREEEAWSDLVAVMEEAVHGQDDVRTAAGRPWVLQLFAQRAAVVLDRAKKVWILAGTVITASVSMIHLVLGVVVVAGSWALGTGRIDAARLTSIWLLMGAFALAVEHVSQILPELQNVLGAWGRIRTLADSPQEPVGGLTCSQGDLTIQGLTFRYPSDEPEAPALCDLNLTFTRGRSYALVGRTGSGKSTLAKVLTRAVDVPRGTVRLGDTDLCDLDLKNLRTWVGMIPQRTEILTGTLAENIALFDPDLLPEADRALRELGLQSWVEDLPDGIDTRLGEGGRTLSAGQAQLVAFARLLVRAPEVVVLDEATARMDSFTEQRVRRAAERLLRGRIGIVIAHRLSTVEHCDEVIVLAEGSVVEAGPLRDSHRFAQLLSAGRTNTGQKDTDLSAPTIGPQPARCEAASSSVTGPEALSVAPGPRPARPAAPRVRTLREIFRLTTNDARLSYGSLVLFLVIMLTAVDGSVLPWLWADLVDGHGGTQGPAVGLVLALLLPMPLYFLTRCWFAQWWVCQMLRINLRLVHGQTGPGRAGSHTPAEVVAQGGDSERVVDLADNLLDQTICLFVVVSAVCVAGTVVPGLFFAGIVLLSALAAACFTSLLDRRAHRTVLARGVFATMLSSSLSAARTVKLAGATGAVLNRLAQLDRTRSDLQRREIAAQVWATSTTTVGAGLLPIAAWALYLDGRLSAGATLVAVATLGSAEWFAWTTSALVSRFPSARVWTRRTTAMTGAASYSASVPGVDLGAGTAPGPPASPRVPLQRMELRGFAAVHDDGSLGVRQVDLTVERGQVVLVLGPVGSGKSSLLRALAGLVHHTGTLAWNGERVTEPEHFLRPHQIGYVAQLPRVLSGSVVDNIRLGHDLDPRTALTTAQLDHDLARTGTDLLIGHKGARLSGGQVQRLALARALAPDPELLVVDDVSSALDVTTEASVWKALRHRGTTVIGCTSRRVALEQADHVVVLLAGRIVDRGTWKHLEGAWGHLAG
ncbi:MAG: ATP-binding cassette, subfamily bacterial [Actinomycetota bacterium]|nr:ATP-binding cassette, subfamily bacterial [Actinomycetota bacterium]